MINFSTSFSSRRIHGAAFLFCFFLLGASFYFQFVEHIEPCPLCILQRIAIFLLGSLSLIAVLHHPRSSGFRIYSMIAVIISMLGASVAGYQVWLQISAQGHAQASACSASLSYMLSHLAFTQTLKLLLQGSGDCSQIPWQFLGLSMAAWMFIIFICLAMTYFYAAFYTKKFKTMNYNLPKHLSPSIFRAYDIRGIINKTLNVNIAFALGLAIGSEAQQRGENRISVGRDGRLSGPQLSKALIAGLLESGCTVIDLGRVPTPLLYFATYVLDSRSGVMLTGSHNPPDYNGFKIVLAGETLAESAILDLHRRIVERDFRQGSGTLESVDIATKYIDYLRQDIQLARPLRIVVDAGNGIAGDIAPALFKALGCEVIPLFCDVDGHFPNHHPDPSQPENLGDLIRKVEECHADVGLAFDGDADRLGVVTNTGTIIWPDRQMMLYATAVLAQHKNAQIIFDVKCTNHLPEVITQQGGDPLMWKTGHSFIKAKLKETGAALAGEMSGHIFFNDRFFGFDDGLYSAARLLEILSADPRDAETVFKDFPDSLSTPELKLPIDDAIKFKFMQEIIDAAYFKDAKLNTLDGLRVDFKDGWGLVRPSNTTPCLVLRFEADHQSALERIQGEFRTLLLGLDPTLVLPF